MVQTFRNLLRRKVRTCLTILGVTAGVLALTLMGAMSEKLNILVEGAAKYYNTRVIVQPRSAGPGDFLGHLLSAHIAEEIRRLPGVDGAFPTAYMLHYEGEEPSPSPGLGFPPLVHGVDARRLAYEKDQYPVVLAAGRLFRPGERSAAMVGADLAGIHKLSLGHTMNVRGRPFRVVGIMERTLAVRDNTVLVPLQDAQELLASALPAPFSHDPYSLASEIEVFPADLAKAAEVAEVINHRIKGVRAVPPGETERRFRQSVKIFNVITIGSAVIAVLIAGLSVVNTMAMAISERTCEIGVKKAIGATDAHIAREFLGEAVVLGFIGGVLGLAGGSVMVSLLNHTSVSQGVIIFVVTKRLAIIALIFATLLGAGAGLYPAMAAARRNPVEALRAG